MGQDIKINKIIWSDILFKIDDLKPIVDINGIDLLHRRDDKGFSSLHWAAIIGKPKLVEQLLNYGLPVDQIVECEDEPQAIHLAAMEGRIEVIDVLLKHGANIDALDRLSCTPLMRACMYGYNESRRSSETVIFLLAKGANPFYKDNVGFNCIHYAVIKGNNETVHLLITIGLNPNDKSHYRIKPLHLAIYDKNQELIELLKPLTKGLSSYKISKFSTKFKAKSYSKICDDAFIAFSRVFVILCFFGAIFWAYPQYALVYFPATHDLYLFHILLIFSSTCIWLYCYKTMMKDPGYLPRNTNEYKNNLFYKLKDNPWLVLPISGKVIDTNLRLCHTCRTVQILRSKHCRYCNRCVARFDHHCVYLSACIGKKNRVSFFCLISNMLIAGLVYMTIILIVIAKDRSFAHHWTNLGYCIKLVVVGGLLTFCTLRRAFINLTQNEEIRKSRCKYLWKKGEFYNPFDKGCFRNLLDHFGFYEKENHL